MAERTKTPHLAGLEVTGPVSFVGVETKSQGGITMVFASTAAEERVRAFAEAGKLAEIKEPAKRRKFLPQTKRWRLEPAKFPTAFSEDDTYFIGRPVAGKKVILQLVHRKVDGRFTAEVGGVMREGGETSELTAGD